MQKTSQRSSPDEAVGLAALAYYLPPETLSLEALARAGKLVSPAATLRDFGFRRVRVAGEISAADLAERAVARLFRRAPRRPDEVDAILYASALAEPAPRAPRNPAALFRYPAARLQHRFGMTRASVTGIGQAGCVSFLSATRLAAAMIRAEPAVRSVLCVSSDVLPAGSKREILYNVISDAACAALVEQWSPVNRIVAYAQVTKGFYWDSGSKGEEIIASYFPTARFVIQEALDKARLKLSDIRLIVPHNVNRKSWEILLKLLGAPQGRFFGRNIGLKGHTIAADHIINLQDAQRRGLLKPGEYVLLFTFGFGAHWGCLILQH